MIVQNKHYCSTIDMKTPRKWGQHSPYLVLVDCTVLRLTRGLYNLQTTTKEKMLLAQFPNCRYTTMPGQPTITTIPAEEEEEEDKKKIRRRKKKTLKGQIAQRNNR